MEMAAQFVQLSTTSEGHFSECVSVCVLWAVGTYWWSEKQFPYAGVWV